MPWIAEILTDLAEYEDTLPRVELPEHTEIEEDALRARCASL